MTIDQFCPALSQSIPGLHAYQYPWQAVDAIQSIFTELLQNLSEDYQIKDGVAIHKEARIDATATILAPAIINAACFVGPHTLLRGGVYLGAGTSVGPGCEIKHSIIGEQTALAHFNFVGDSLIGDHCNFEAGALTANHYNERDDKTITALWDGEEIKTNVTKFGACLGDHTKIGANAVTSPGTILPPHSIVRRLELIEQIPLATERGTHE